MVAAVATTGGVAAGAVAEEPWEAEKASAKDGAGWGSYEKTRNRFAGEATVNNHHLIRRVQSRGHMLRKTKTKNPIITTKKRFEAGKGGARRREKHIATHPEAKMTGTTAETAVLLSSTLTLSPSVGTLYAVHNKNKKLSRTTPC